MADPDLILLALEDPQIIKLFKSSIETGPFRVSITTEGHLLEKELQVSSPSAVIISEDFSGFQGLRLAGSLIDRFPTLPVILFIASANSNLCLEGLRQGISDCLFPPLRPADIRKAVETAMKRANHLGDWLRREVRRTTEPLEKQLTELSMLQVILDNIENGIILLDQDRNILLINPAARKAFGLNGSDAQGKSILKVIPHDDLRSLLSFGTVKTPQYHEIMVDDDHIFNAQYASIPGVGSVISMQDISYLKKVDRVKDDFVSTVSHDLRTPLTAIQGYVELMDRVGPLNAQQEDFVSRIQISIKNVTTLVNDLLELGKIEAGITGITESVRLDEVLGSCQEDSKLQMEKKGITVTKQVPDQLPPVTANPVRIRQMVQNLLGNAIKFSPVGGKVQVTLYEDKGQVFFQVSDNGPGIPLADQPHIFEKFYRASNVQGNVEGTGLGLAIVKSIVENHHGRIWLDSAPGRGSTFTVVLPVA